MLQNNEDFNGEDIFEPEGQPDYSNAFLLNFLETLQGDRVSVDENIYCRLSLAKIFTMRENLSEILNYENV
jgi:hypothetical protein